MKEMPACPSACLEDLLDIRDVGGEVSVEGGTLEEISTWLLRFFVGEWTGSSLKRGSTVEAIAPTN